MPQKITYLLANGVSLCAQNHEQPEIILFIDQQKTDPNQDLYFLFEAYSRDYTLCVCQWQIDPKLDETVKKYFNILDWGGIFYVDTNDKRFVRTVNVMMLPQKEFILKLAPGVEKKWSYPRVDKRISDVIDFILTR